MGRNSWFILVSSYFFLVSLTLSQTLPERYYQMDFRGIVRELENCTVDSLTVEQQCYWIESQARLGNGAAVQPRIQRLLAQRPGDERVLTAAGVWYFSLGNLPLAEAYLNRALTMNPRNENARLARTMLLLYLRRFAEAEDCFRQVAETNPGLKQTRLYRRVGGELYSALQDPSKMTRYFTFLQKYYASQNNQERSGKYRRKIRLLTGLEKQSLYRVHGASARVEFPLVDFAPGVFYKCLLLERNGKSYKILLDTGNAVGWTIHNPELLTLLKNHLGTEQSISTGSVEKSLTGRELLTLSLDLGEIHLVNLLGSYFARPRRDYFDANLNPIFLRNRVVTLDFVHNRLILRSKEQFDRDLATTPPADLTKLPFYGYEWPFVPVLVNGYAPALAMIETGAEDLSLKEEFARFIQLPLTPATKIWGNQQYSYYLASRVGIQLGTRVLYRLQMEIWPRRFYDQITGLYDQVMIGPMALEGRFVVSFDPFENVIVFQTDGRN